jgi:phosphoribosylformimino-5-aminoimidazole carboxamide ribotide isomerase
MDLYPSIDLRAGQVVRLYQGDYARETVYEVDAVTAAKAFADAGARWIHVVDLDAARSGEPVNRPVIGMIAEAVSGRARVQASGGVRTDDAAAALADAVSLVSSSAPPRSRTLRSWRGRGAPTRRGGLDARQGEVALRGWLEGSGEGCSTCSSVRRRGRRSGHRHRHLS